MSLSIRKRVEGKDLEKAIGFERKYSGFEFLSSNQATSFFLFEDETLIGEVDYQVVFDSADVLFIYIDEEKRGKGYSTYLMKDSLEELSKDGVKEIFLEVRKTNLPALNLYRSVGFIKISERKQYYENGEDAILMKLSR